MTDAVARFNLPLDYTHWLVHDLVYTPGQATQTSAFFILQHTGYIFFYRLQR